MCRVSDSLGVVMGFLLAVATLLPVGVAAETFKGPDSLIVHFADSARLVATTAGVRPVKPGVALVSLSAGLSRARSSAKRQLNDAMNAWRQHPDVLFVEPNYHGRFADIALEPIPNDPQYEKQWWLERVGARGLWAVGKGAGVKIAVIDSGVQLGHPDLESVLEPDGYDFGDDNPSPEDRLGHGTGVAGVIAAVADNGLGISGVAPSARILPLKISPSAEPVFSTEALVRAIDYAVAKNVQIINLSLVVEQETRLLRTAIQAALDRGVVVVAAAGNDGGAVAFPANMDGVVAVAATDRGDGLMPDSSRGDAIAIAAPGEQIFTTDLAGGYSLRQGTSFAAPIVTGTLAALQSANPTVLSRWRGFLAAEGLPMIAGQPFRLLDATWLARRTIPHIIPANGRWMTSDLFVARYELPPYGAPVDIYVALSTPLGDIVLQPDCSWAGIHERAPLPILPGYRADEATEGPLFDVGAFCPTIPLQGLPGGRYTWHIGAVVRANGRLLGSVDSSPVDIVD